MLKQILSVDDSHSVHAMVTYTLKNAGYEVVEAFNGQDALRMAKGASFDMVLTDQYMPGMDGLALVSALRALPAYKRTPILVLTTEIDGAMKNKGRACGATGWMTKPFHPEKLVLVVNKLTAS